MAKIHDSREAKLSVIKSIEAKVGKIAARNLRLAADNDKLRQQNTKVKAENASLKEKLAEQARRIAALELRDGFAGGGQSGQNTRKAQTRVSRLLREVDKCIALVNNGQEN